MLITALAVIIRSIPAWMNAAWGVDFGIYFGLTKNIATYGVIFPEYTGWGSSYNYFPTLYLINVGAHWITGLDILVIMPKLAPIFGGLSVFVFYFIVKELIKDKKIALISSALLAVSVLHIYQTSHAAPLTIGHFFMMISLYFFIKFQRNPMFSIPLIASTALLIFSHHFTTYFYLITITFLTFAYVSKRKKINHQILYIITYVLFASTATFAHWIFIATPVYRGFMNVGYFIPPYVVIAAFYVFVILGTFISAKFNWFNPLKNINFNFLHFDMDKYKKIALSFLILLATVIVVSITGIPGVYIKITPLAIVYALPMLFVLALSYAGLSYLSSIRDGFLIKGWFIGIFLSLTYSLTSASLLPDRHLEYLIVPLCIPAALTLKEIINDHPLRNLKRHTMELIEPAELSKRFRRNVIASSLIAILFIANLIAAYPAIDSLNAIDERVSEPCVNTLDWMAGNVNNMSIFASDHRLEMLIWAEGFGITYGKTNTTWFAENLSEYKDELIQLNVTHIVVDDIMRDGVVNVDVGKYYYMTNESYEKFNYTPFKLIYRNATYDNEDEEIHWVEVYQVDRSILMKDE